MTELDKDKRIKKEKQKLNKVFKSLPPEKFKVAEKLIENCAFMSVTLDDLAQQIKEEGTIITSTNGNGFEVMNEHPAQKSYSTLINRYNASIKLLIDMLPKDEVKKEDTTTALADFLAKKPSIK